MNIDIKEIFTVFIALEIILGVTLYKEEETKLTASVFPLAFPLIAGPGSITTVRSLKSNIRMRPSSSPSC